MKGREKERREIELERGRYKERNQTLYSVERMIIEQEAEGRAVVLVKAVFSGMVLLGVEKTNE